MISPDAINRMLTEHWPEARVRCAAVSATSTRAILTPRPENIRPGGFISGPTQFAAADSALWFLVCGVSGAAVPMALTSELSIRFLRPALGAALHSEAVLERAGRRTVVATVRVWTDERERPCATAQGTYFRPENQAPPP